MSTNDCRAVASVITGIWTRWFLFRGACPCLGCATIVASQINLDRARRIASRELVLS